MGSSGAGPAGGDPGAGLRSSGHQDAHVPAPAPRTKVSRTAPPKCARVGPGTLGVGAQRSPARPPPSPHRWVNPKAPKATCLHTKRAVALQRDGRQQPVSFSRHHGQLPASPGVDPAPQASQAGSLVRLHGHAGPWGDSRAVCPPTSLQMQPPKPAALPGGATPSKGFPPLSGP